MNVIEIRKVSFFTLLLPKDQLAVICEFNSTSLFNSIRIIRRARRFASSLTSIYLCVVDNDA